jgi:CheY-like chemotaxis protein
MVNTMKYELGKRKLENYRVLVLDSDQDSQEIILEVLRWEAYDARGVASAKEAHKLFNTWVPHVVILDWASASKADFKILNDNLT